MDISKMSYVTDNTNLGESQGRGRRDRVVEFGRRKTIHTEGCVTNFTTRDTCFTFISSRICKYFTAGLENYDENTNYTSIFNSWLMGAQFGSSTYTCITHAQTGEPYFEISRSITWNTDEGPVIKSAKGRSSSKSQAENLVDFNLVRNILGLPRFQICYPTESIQDTVSGKVLTTYFEKLNVLRSKRTGQIYFPRVQIDDTEQGEPTQDSDKKENTIITMDQAQSISIHTKALDTVQDISSTENPVNFTALTNRWMPLSSIPISTSDTLGTILKTYYLPEALYSQVCAPNLTPFESYIYGRLDLEVRLVVNANKFCCGKVIMSSKYDTYQADNVCIGYQSALARNHVIVDLATNNEGLLKIPFRYHRPYLRLTKNDASSVGVRPSKYCSVYVQVLSPLQTGPNGPSDVDLRAYYRFTQANFTGMSYRVSVQMDVIGEALGLPVSGLKNVLVTAEKIFDQLGQSRNQDKPSVIYAEPVIPRPRLNFTSGKGVTDIVPLRMNPHTLTNYTYMSCPTDEPKSFYDLARIWGIVKEFAWNKTTSSNEELFTMVIDPMSRNYSSDYIGEPTPLEYACANYAFWSGTIELRFDFVSNMFHTGTVQITAEFGRKTASSNLCESSSTYTKNFHLGDQKTVSFRVPYIYDTVMRRTTGLVYNPYQGTATTDVLKKNSLSVAPESHTIVKVKVMNPLRPAQNAAQEIKVLVFMRAGKNFCMHGLKSTAHMPDNNVVEMDSFPRDYKTPAENVARRKRSGDEKEKKDEVDPHMSIPKADRNEWGEYKADRLPRPQMDNGEKEDQDPTLNFAEGSSALPTLTTDSQVDFKDLLRRPTLLMWRQEVDPSASGGFFIPLQPPNRQMVTTDNMGKNNVFAHTLSQTSAVSIMDMFRCWRGGMRYTIVSEGNKPFYVSLIPHSGVRIVGNHNPIGTGEFPVCGANFFTELVVPSVNPTVTVEAPYDTENTWTLTFDEDAKRNYSWRDKGDYNSGHLVITAVEKTVMTIWWSAGDDFEFANFYGIPKIKNNSWAYRYNDTHAVVQVGDFNFQETFTKVTGFSLSTQSLSKMAMSCVPGVGVPIVAASLAHRAEETLERSEQTMHRLDALVETTGIAIGDISNVLREAVNKVTGMMSGIVQGTVLIYDFLLDLLIGWMEKSWRVVGIAFIRMIVKILPGASIEKVIDWGVHLGEYIRLIIMGETPQVQIENTDSQATLVGILVGIIGTLFGVTFDDRRTRSLPSELFHRLTHTSGVSYLVQVLRFVTSIFKTIKELVLEALGYVSPEARALKMFGTKSELLNEFIREAQIITSESNAAVLSLPNYRIRVWKTVMQAHQIQRLIMQIPTNVASGQLSRLCYEVIKFGNEKFLDLAASPVRYEPFVICIEGDSRTGKSHMTEDLVAELLDEIGYTNVVSERIYYRTSGEKFWSGYRDQPVIVYDEWLNTTSMEKNVEQIVEFQKLKSTSMFIPEMAHLEEKKIKGNPLIIVMLTNNAFPNVSDYARTPQAVFSRRDVLLHCSRTSEFEGIDLKNTTPEIYAQAKQPSKPHLQFLQYKDVVNPNSKGSVYRTYEEAVKFLRTKFKRYHVRATEDVQQRMRRLPGFAETIDHEIVLEDPFTLFYGLNNTVMNRGELAVNAWTPYEQLEAAVISTADAILGPRDATPMELPPDLTWEQARSMPVTQGWPMVVAGALFGAHALYPIVCMGAEKVNQWLKECRQVRTTEGWCSICREETRCGYVCQETRGTEAKHLLCLSCYHGLNATGNGMCPMCRCREIRPIFDDDDLAHLGLWMRAAFKFGKGTKWFLDKLATYYGWRITSPMSATYCDFYWGVVSIFLTLDISFFTGAHYACLVSHLAINAAMMYDRGVVNYITDMGQSAINFFQVDDWNDDNDYARPMERERQAAEDRLEVRYNEQYVQKCIDAEKDIPVCLHAWLVPRARNVHVRAHGWELTDPTTRRVIQIPFELCKDCSLSPQDYRQFIEQMALVKRTELRCLYIDYINDPTDHNANRIPEVFRPEWMIVEKIPPLVTWWDYLSDVYSQYRTLIIYTLGITSVLGSLVGIYQLATRFSNPSGSQASSVYDGGDRPNHRRGVEVRRGTERRYFQSASEDQQTVCQVVEKHLVRNMMMFSLKGADRTKVMYGIGVFNHICLVPKHYIDEIRKGIGNGFDLYVQPLASPQLSVKLDITPRTFVASSETDMAYIRLPPSLPLFKDIRKYCAKDEDFNVPIPSSAILLAPPRTTAAPYIREIDVDVHGVQNIQIIQDLQGDCFEIRDVLKYNYSQPGVCGAITLRPDHTRPIMSMHVAGVGVGTDGYGYGVLLTQEALADLSKDEIIVQMDDVEYDTLEKAKFVYEENVHLKYYGSVPPEKVPYIPTKSKLVKSVVFGVEDLMAPVEPAILSTQDSRYLHKTTPLYEGAKKHGLVTSNFPQAWVDKAREQLWDAYISKMPPLVADPKRLTYEEAIVGFDIDHYGAMDLKTSAGYPYMLSKDKKSKENYITVRRNEQLKAVGVDYLDPVLVKRLEENELKRREGIIPHTLFIDTLKDEKRKTEKITKVGGTRVFCNAPLDSVIATRQNFMHFLAAFMKHRHTQQHAVGINPTSSEWGRLCTNLLLKGNKIVTIDYANFGPGYNVMVAEAAYELIVRWVMEHVKGVDEVELRVLCRECFQSMHICNNTVYQQFAGSPSGAVFTTIINTLVNELYLLIAWNQLTATTLLGKLTTPIDEWMKEVCLYAYGDDAIISVSDKYIEIFNAETISAFFQKYGIVATDAGKTGKITPFANIFESTFLKRGFTRHPYRKGEWLSPLDVISIKGTTQWVWKSANVGESTEVNCAAALLQAHGHGPEFFQRFKNTVNRALLKAKCKPVTIQWEEIDELFFTTGLEFITDQLINSI